MVSLRLPGRTLRRGTAASRPRSSPISERLLTRGLFCLIYAISAKFIVGFPLKNKKFPKFCCSKLFFPRTVKDSFLQMYKGKENHLKGLADLNF